MLAGGQIDAPQAGIAKQGGDSHFLQRFALETHGGFDAAGAMKFSLQHQNPPVTAWLRGGRDYPELTHSLLANSNSAVLLWALKPAEDGPAAGLVARFWNVGSTAQEYTVSLTGGVSKAVRTTHIETDLEPLAVRPAGITNRIAPTQIQTIRMVPAGGAAK